MGSDLSPTGSIGHDTFNTIQSLYNMDFNNQQDIELARTCVNQLKSSSISSITIEKQQVEEILQALEQISTTLDQIVKNTQRNSFLISVAKESLVSALKIFISIFGKNS